MPVVKKLAEEIVDDARRLVELLVQEKDDIVKRLAFFGVVPEPTRSAPRQPRVRGF